MIRILALLLLLNSFLFTSCSDDSPAVFSFNQKISLGDSLVWAQKEYDDSHWFAWEEEIPKDSIFWVRFNEEFPDFKTDKAIGLRITAIGSYEIFWDGHYLGSNGQIAQKNKREVSGKYIHYVLLPDSLSQKGEHVLALRCSKTHINVNQHAFFIADEYYELVTEPIQVSKYMFFIGGMFFIAAIYFLFIYTTNLEDYSFLIFGIICLIFLGLLVLEYYKLFAFYDYNFQRKRLTIISYLHIGLSFLIPFFFATEFKFPWRKYLLVIILLGILIIEGLFDLGFDTSAVFEDRMMWIISLGVVLYAAYQKKKEAYIVLMGFIGSVLVFYFTPYLKVKFVSVYDVAVFASFVCIILSMLYVLSYRRREQRLAFQESLVVSERLKNELLKKNIKPHFIMNTLTSLIDWVEDSPKDGVQFIHALADEFDVLNEIADYKLVPIDQEIKLCKNHLKVMQFRKEVNYKWVQNGVDSNEIIPPAVLHTIVENGVTHSKPNENGEVVFILNYTRDKQEKKYSILVKAQIEDKVSYDENTNRVLGTGTKYIKSRLRESYGDKWTYISNRTDEGWLTEIIIKQ